MNYLLQLEFLKSGFDRYKGGLDTVHDLTGLYSIFTRWRGIEIMFHVSTHLPNDPNDHQKVSLGEQYLIFQIHNISNS